MQIQLVEGVVNSSPLIDVSGNAYLQILDDDLTFKEDEAEDQKMYIMGEYYKKYKKWDEAVKHYNMSLDLSHDP